MRSSGVSAVCFAVWHVYGGWCDVQDTVLRQHAESHLLLEGARQAGQC